MFKSQIVKIFRGYDSDKIGMGKNHEKELKEFDRLHNLMLNKIGEDAESKKILVQLENATSDLNYSDIDEYFREGFIFGARLALEICGVECDEEN